MFVDNSTRELGVSRVDSHPVWISLPRLAPALHQDDLTAAPGSPGVETLNSQPRVLVPPAPRCPDFPGELKSED